METATHLHLRINQLDNRLANQIAAGEVVERPASVVKELLENAIDAKASRIEVDIERGGARLIRVTDNGSGIVKDDLILALARHATSKISKTEDLAAINSLGFRGEALASIASVSKLTLTSRTVDSDFAWQAIAEGRDMKVVVQPASATQGTRIEVRDLFYNTPARQKFLRAEKTEFAHIEEIFKRHALANYETAFILKHNHKVVKRIPAGNSSGSYLKRIETICGKPFAQNALEFSCQHELVNLRGWTGGTQFHRSESDIQYVFVNGRPVKDKMLNHAIRQSFQGMLPAGRMPTFVMFLEIDAQKIDVNVHPTKHEIRFDEQRMIHDLIVSSISESLKSEQPLSLDSALAESQTQNGFLEQENRNPEYLESGATQRASMAGAGYSHASYRRFNHHQIQPEGLLQTDSDELKNSGVENIEVKEKSPIHYPGTAKNVEAVSVAPGMISIGKDYHAIEMQGALFVVKNEKLLVHYLTSIMITEAANKSLLFPRALPIDSEYLEQFEVIEFMHKLGFVFTPQPVDQVLIRKVPLWLTGAENEVIFEFFQDATKKITDSLGRENTASILLSIAELIMPFSESVIQWITSQSEFLWQESDAAIRMTEEMIQKVLR